MTEQDKCDNCGSPLPDSLRGGLCPACLLKRGLETNTVGFTDEDQAEAARRWTPPTVEQLASIFPELDILELIGRGGMGAVYKAREKQLDRLVALKILPPEIGREPAFAQRFAREAQAMAKLGHSNIVTIYSFGSRPFAVSHRLQTGAGDGEKPAPPESAPVSLYYFIMEYVDGLSLRQLLDAAGVGADNKRAAMNPKEALAIVPQICDALQYAHDRGIVHRDIKPENILLNRAGQVKIADFGLVKLVGLTAAGAADQTVDAGSPGAPGSSRRSSAQPDVTQAGEKVMGTPQYMAPEQIERPREVDHRADIYSLGVVFYQMLTGELPKGKFEPPSRKVLIDVRLDEVVLRALEREPARRYQQVSEVRTQVETIASGMADSRGMAGPAMRPTAVSAVEKQDHGQDAHATHDRARQSVKAPAIGMIVVACGWGGMMLVALLVMGLKVFGAISARQVGHGLPLPVTNLDTAVIIMGIGALALVAVNAFVLISARKMMRLEGRGAAIAAAILLILQSLGLGGGRLVIIALAVWGLAGLVFGIWALVVLCRRDIVEAFRNRLNGRSLPHAESPSSPSGDAGKLESPRQSVKAPAIGMVVAAGINLLVVMVLAILLVVSMLSRGNQDAARQLAAQHEARLAADRAYSSADAPAVEHPATRPAPFDAQSPAGPQTQAPLKAMSWGVLAFSVPVLLGLPLHLVVLFGAVRMMRLRSRGLAITAAILALIAAPGNIIGLPMGIWALVVLNRREVVEAFKLSEKNRNMRKSKMSLLIVLLVVLGVGLAGAGAVIHAQGQQNVDMLKALAHVVDQKHATTQAVGDWKVTLPSGVTVEMIGVSENPSDGKPWWGPEGSPLLQRPYTHLGASVTPGPDRRGNEFAVRLGNLPKEDVGIRWEFDPPTSYAGGGIHGGDAVTQLRAIAAQVPSSQSVITVKLGVAAGTWTTLAKATGSGSSSSGRGNVAVSFSPTHEDVNAVVVTVAHNVADQDIRVVAVDVSGRELKPGRSTTGGAGNIRQLTCTFYNVKLSDIKEFRLQSRPYEWATFKNVALRPAFAQPNELAWAEAILPPGETKSVPVILDLATNTMLPLPDLGTLADDNSWPQHFTSWGKGDIGFNENVIFLLRGAKLFRSSGADVMEVKPLETQADVSAFTVPPMPAQLMVLTAEGNRYLLNVVAIDKDGLHVRFRALTSDAAGTGPADQSHSSMPRVIRTTPAAFANNVDPATDKITVTFDRPMMDKSWSFTAGDKAFSEKTGSQFPERPSTGSGQAGEISYDAARTTCTMPVKLQPGKVYWVGVNSPQHQQFKSAVGTPARPYQILFATRSADGKPTPLPEELVKQAREINVAAHADAVDEQQQVRDLVAKFLAALWDGKPLEAMALGATEGWLPDKPADMPADVGSAIHVVAGLHRESVQRMGLVVRLPAAFATKEEMLARSQRVSISDKLAVAILDDPNATEDHAFFFWKGSAGWRFLGVGGGPTNLPPEEAMAQYGGQIKTVVRLALSATSPAGQQSTQRTPGGMRADRLMLPPGPQGQERYIPIVEVEAPVNHGLDFQNKQVRHAKEGLSDGFGRSAGAQSACGRFEADGAAGGDQYRRCVVANAVGRHASPLETQPGTRRLISAKPLCRRLERQQEDTARYRDQAGQQRTWRSAVLQCGRGGVGVPDTSGRTSSTARHAAERPTGSR